MISEELLSVIACPRCKGGLEPQTKEGGLYCPACTLLFPVKNGIPLLLVEEARAGGTSAAEAPTDGGAGPKVRLLVVEGKNKGEVIEIEKGSCRAVGRSLDETEKTRAFSVASAVTLDEQAKKLVVNYIAKQFRKEAPATSEEGSLGTFRRMADIYLRDSAVSRLHAMIFYDESGIGILDLVSKNGTFVNGIEVESKLLKKGDMIMIGATKFRWE